MDTNKKETLKHFITQTNRQLLFSGMLSEIKNIFAANLRHNLLITNMSCQFQFNEPDKELDWVKLIGPDGFFTGLNEDNVIDCDIKINKDNVGGTVLLDISYHLMYGLDYSICFFDRSSIIVRRESSNGRISFNNFIHHIPIICEMISNKEQIVKDALEAKRIKPLSEFYAEDMAKNDGENNA